MMRRIFATDNFSAIIVPQEDGLKTKPTCLQPPPFVRGRKGGHSRRSLTPKLAQYLSQANTWVKATSCYRVSLNGPALMPHMLEAMRQGIAAGQAIRAPLIMVAWEDYLDWPLEDICTDLAFERGPGEAWTWSREASLT